MNWVKVICVCELHVFFQKCVADLREERSEPEMENYVLRSDSRTGGRGTFPEPFLPQSGNMNWRSADRIFRT